MQNDDELAEKVARDGMDPNGCNRCKDFDEDCFGLDHLHCWLYDPTQGLCPFLMCETEKPATSEGAG